MLAGTSHSPGLEKATWRKVQLYGIIHPKQSRTGLKTRHEKWEDLGETERDCSWLEEQKDVQCSWREGSSKKEARKTNISLSLGTHFQGFHFILKAMGNCYKT